MQITHQEAHQLIRQQADESLEAGKWAMLHSHLQGCADCAEYANELQQVEATLRRTLHKQWRVRPLALDVMEIKGRVIPNSKPSEFLATRTALVGMAVLVFFMVFWQFNFTKPDFQNPRAIGVPAIPTPSLPLTSTQNNFDNCQMIRYEVQQNDTVDSLSHRFLVSEDVIRNFNHLQPEVASLPSLLVIPACESTPTSTTYPATSTTNTPSLELVTYTPG